MMPPVKIICTIGPATWDPDVVRQLIDLGMTAARVNGAFADPDELDKVKRLVRMFSKDVSLMVDVKGPEIRLNKFKEPLKIKPGDTVIIGSNPERDQIYPTNYPDIYKLLKKGNKIVVGDGDVVLIVDKVDELEGKIYATVEFGEQIKPGKALNLVGVSHTEEVLTQKDIVNLKHGLSTGWDMVSASFIKNKTSALKVREVIGDKMHLIAKIEDEEGVQNIDEILEVVDGIMVARGGLGVSMGLEYVPVVERELIRKANQIGKPVITATQLLESMVENPFPTRAEVNDIETAVLLGTDGLMLSGETAAGKYPVEAVRTLVEISKFAYSFVEPREDFPTSSASLTTLALANAAIDIAHDMGDQLSAVVIVTRSGTTARLVARGNLKQPIYVFTNSELSKKGMNLVKGVRAAFLLEKGPPGFRTQRDVAVDFLKQLLQEYGLVKSGQRVLVLGKTPITGEEFFPNVFEVMTI